MLRTWVESFVSHPNPSSPSHPPCPSTPQLGKRVPGANSPDQSAGSAHFFRRPPHSDSVSSPSFRVQTAPREPHRDAPKG
ncbi:hypothetical protein GQ53DRAFT_243917 [Thozetella sp. PMI_491]|nr:hypothetical protein GQ53DRAFT_243917 [Thozetella sp. PMI_491]